MSAIEPFFDSNVILYLLSADATKAERAEDLLAAGGVISVQVLNEFVAVARRKYKIDWPRIEEVTSAVRAVCRIEPVTLSTHELGLHIARRHRYGFYDCLILAAAIKSGARTIFTEDMQHGQRIESITIHNPFAGL